jgi:predicted TIM-barrel fold metal-dependent hydrolase
VKPAFVDTHQHLWDPARFSYSWLADFPTLNQRFMLEEYRAATPGLDIVRTVYVDTDVDEASLPAETAAIFALAAQPGSRIGGIVPGAKLEKADCWSHLQPFFGHPLLKGVRRVLHTMPDELSQQPQFIANVRSLPERGLSFDVCVLARQLPLAQALVRRCPQVSFILDHCGVPDVKGQAFDPWREQLRELSHEPNIVCKISGLVAYADPQHWTTEHLRPFFVHAIACFGWDRVLWGSDWPVCTLTSSLARWAQTAQELAAQATPDERDRLFRRNAERVYRLT